MWGMDLLTVWLLTGGPHYLWDITHSCQLLLWKGKTALLLLMVAVSVVYRVHVFVCQNAS